MASPYTSATYERAITTLRTGLKVAEGLEFLENAPAVIAWIDASKYATNSRKTFYIAVVSTLKKNNLYPDALAAYRVKMDSLNHEIAVKAESQEMTEVEKAKYMEWPQILEVYERIRQAACDLQTFQEYLIVSLYVLQPPVRLDYGEMRIVTKEPTEHGANYLVLSKKPYFLFTDYKTYKTHGAQRTPLVPALCDVIREWRAMVDDEYLLIASNGLPLKADDLGQIIIRIFEKHANKSVGVGVLRHSYASWMRRNELSFKESKQLASQMGHSQTMSALYRRLT